MTKEHEAKIIDHIIYYCKYHNSIIDSDKVNTKGRKTPIRKCNSRIIYENKNIYYLETEHSDICLNISKLNYSNLADINIEIRN